MAWPPQQVLAHLKIGQKVTVVKVNMAHPMQDVRTNPAGLVNLEFVPDPGNGGCTTPIFKKDLGSHPGYVMQSYSYINTTQKFTYGEGQSTGFGIGLSVSGKAGSFSADGQTSVSTTDSQGFNPQKGPSNNHFGTYFEIGRFIQICTAAGEHHTNHLVMPYQWNAGTKYNHPKIHPLRDPLRARAQRRHLHEEHHDSGDVQGGVFHRRLQWQRTDRLLEQRFDQVHFPSTRRPVRP